LKYSRTTLHQFPMVVNLPPGGSFECGRISRDSFDFIGGIFIYFGVSFLISRRRRVTWNGRRESERRRHQVVGPVDGRGGRTGGGRSEFDDDQFQRRRDASTSATSAAAATASVGSGADVFASVGRSGSIGPQVAGRWSKNGTDASASADDCRQTVPRTRTG
jgi:hypothetical protein